MAGETISLATFVTGGSAPYVYGVAIGDATPEPGGSTGATGWITKDIKAPNVSTEKIIAIKVVATDAKGKDTERIERILVRPHGSATPSLAGSAASPVPSSSALAPE